MNLFDSVALERYGKNKRSHSCHSEMPQHLKHGLWWTMRLICAQWLWQDVVDMPLMVWNCERIGMRNLEPSQREDVQIAHCWHFRETADVWGVTPESRMCLVGREEISNLCKEWLSLTGYDGCLFTGGAQADVEARAKYWGSKELGKVLLIICFCKLGFANSLDIISKTKFHLQMHLKVSTLWSQAMWIPILTPLDAI